MGLGCLEKIQTGEGRGAWSQLWASGAHWCTRGGILGHVDTQDGGTGEGRSRWDEGRYGERAQRSHPIQCTGKAAEESESPQRGPAPAQPRVLVLSPCFHSELESLLPLFIFCKEKAGEFTRLGCAVVKLTTSEASILDSNPAAVAV